MLKEGAVNAETQKELSSFWYSFEFTVEKIKSETATIKYVFTNSTVEEFNLTQGDIISALDDSPFPNPSIIVNVHHFISTLPDSTYPVTFKVDINDIVLSKDKVLSLGDVSGDNRITMLDVVTLQKSIANLIKLSNNKATAADVNRDKKQTMEDVVLIQKYIVNLIDNF